MPVRVFKKIFEFLLTVEDMSPIGNIVPYDRFMKSYDALKEKSKKHAIEEFLMLLPAESSENLDQYKVFISYDPKMEPLNYKYFSKPGSAGYQSFI